MDVSKLIAGFVELKPEYEETKAAALRFAHSVTAAGADLSEFVSQLPPQITKFRYGSPADDAYFTAVFASLAQHDPLQDYFLASVLNKIALQLTFQTRFLAAGHPPDVFIIDGNRDLLPLALINADGVAGILIYDRVATMPDWASAYPHIKMSANNLLSSTPSEVKNLMEDLTRPVGCVALTLPVRAGEFSLAKRLAPVEAHVSKYTSYVFCGPASSVLNVKRQIEASYPDAGICYKAYLHAEQKAVCVVENCDRIPDISLLSDGEALCQFRYVQDIKQGLQFKEYAAQQPVRAKAPISVLSTAPLTDENISKMEFSADMVFHAIVIADGTVIPAVNTFLYKTKHDEILFDMADNTESFRSTALYKSGETRDGVHCAVLDSAPTMIIDGPAMPLFFTPNLHEWFSHFLIQCFPRVKILRDLAVQAKVLVPTTLRKKQRAMLHMIGIAEDDIVEVPDGVRVRATELIVPRVWPLMFSDYTASIYDELSAKVLQGRPEAPSKRLLISRNSRQTWRNMLTYDAIKFLLVGDFDFVEVFPEKLTLEEEIELFHDASIIAGAEGAGLYGACYAQSGAKALVIGDEDYVMPILATLATCRGFEMAYVFGESFRSDLDVKRRLGFGHANFVVDPVEVARMVRTLS